MHVFSSLQNIYGEYVIMRSISHKHPGLIFSEGAGFLDVCPNYF
jgi:hypothetical protein